MLATSTTSPRGIMTLTDQTTAAAPSPRIDQLMSSIRDRLDEALGDLGRFNLLVVGNTGAGKSTLINSIFGWQIARTGNGRPVTQGTTAYAHPHLPLTIFDTRGIEIGEERTAITERLVGEIKRRRPLPVEEQIHTAWYAVRWSDRRIEDGQIQVIHALAAAGVPVILALTQVPYRGGEYHPDALEFANSIVSLGLPLQPGSGLVLTAAIDDPWTGEAHGLQGLLDMTFSVAPEGARSALTAAQQIDRRRKRDAAMAIVVQHAAAASAAAASPIPFSDAAALIPIQITMLVRITALWGLDIGRATLATTIGSALLTSGATFVGRQIVGNALKLIPGIGWIAGAALNAGVAGAVTTGIGTAWSSLVERLADTPEAVAAMSPADIRKAFEAELRKAKRGEDATSSNNQP